MPLTSMFLSFSGRVKRIQFWLYAVLAITVVEVVVLVLLGTGRAEKYAAGFWLNLLLLWPSLAVAAKRWHDRDKSAWWMLIVLVPFVGWLWFLIELGFLPGTPGPNRFGDDQ